MTRYNFIVTSYRVVEMKRANLSYIVRSYGGVTDFAKECGVTTAAVYGWLRSNSLPMKRAAEMASLYGVDRDLFYDPWYGSEQGASVILTDDETQSTVFGRKK